KGEDFGDCAIIVANLVHRGIARVRRVDIQINEMPVGRAGWRTRENLLARLAHYKTRLSLMRAHLVRTGRQVPQSEVAHQRPDRSISLCVIFKETFRYYGDGAMPFVAPAPHWTSGQKQAYPHGDKPAAEAFPTRHFEYLHLRIV